MSSAAPIVPLTPAQAPEVARLHAGQIHTGFLSSLGIRFLRQLYVAIPSCPSGFGYVWQGANGRVAGFIACAESTKRLYRQALVRRGLHMSIPLVRYMVRPAVIRRLWQTLRYPSRVSEELPEAEVLSIAVSSDAQSAGIGRSLMEAALDEFRRRGIPAVRVAVGADNERANRFYERCGFRLAQTREHHGALMNIHAIDLTARRDRG